MKNNKGFSLIELLVVVALIGILSAVGIGTFQSAQRKGRDAQRKNDLSQIKKTLIAARSDCKGGNFPIGTSTTPEDTAYTALTTYLVSQNYLKAALIDPKNNNPYVYGLTVPSSTAQVCPDTTTTYNEDGTTAFVLRSPLEQGTNDPQAGASFTRCSNIIATTALNGTASAIDGYYYVCSN